MVPLFAAEIWGYFRHDVFTTVCLPEYVTFTRFGTVDDEANWRCSV